MTMRKKMFLITGTLILLIIATCMIYLMSYYHADTEAIEALSVSGVSVTELDDGNIVIEPENAAAGLIFYPGGKVEHSAYIPLMQECAERGILCVIVEMPFRLAVFDINGAEGICDQFPYIDSWYIGGHSLGGSMAAQYLSSCEEEYKGLVLLGSYSATDISDMDIEVLSIYGENDNVLDRNKYKENLTNLPDSLTEKIIDGGNHAYFGMYGDQKGDGKAEISNEEQIEAVAELIASGCTRG